MKIKKVENIVQSILEEKPQTRQNDNLLILEYVKKTQRNEKLSFEAVMKDINVSFESITRARRKLQKRDNRLRDKTTADFRREREAEYFEYYKNA